VLHRSGATGFGATKREPRKGPYVADRIEAEAGAIAGSGGEGREGDELVHGLTRRPADRLFARGSNAMIRRCAVAWQCAARCESRAASARAQGARRWLAGFIRWSPARFRRPAVRRTKGHGREGVVAFGSPIPHRIIFCQPVQVSQLSMKNCPRMDYRN